MVSLEKHHEKLSQPSEDKLPLGWFTYGGNNRVKHYYVQTATNPRGISLCRQSSLWHESTKIPFNKNPLARVNKKCVACKRRILNKKGVI